MIAIWFCALWNQICCAEWPYDLPFKSLFIKYAICAIVLVLNLSSKIIRVMEIILEFAQLVIFISQQRQFLQKRIFLYPKVPQNVCLILSLRSLSDFVGVSRGWCLQLCRLISHRYHLHSCSDFFARSK